nr:type II toxin-antitoxin system PemK/MazF family toxin [Paenibacillus lautus]
MGKKYADLKPLNEKSKEILYEKARETIEDLKYTDYNKFSNLIKVIPENLRLSYDSIEVNKQRTREGKEKGQHPIKPIYGQIYNAYLGENLGSELSGEHPVVIVQNSKGNLFSQKVNVLPIEGDGNVIKEPYQKKLTSDDLEGDTKLTKDPSRIIISDIMTIDKKRLGIKIGKIKDEVMSDIYKRLIEQLKS